MKKRIISGMLALILFFTPVTASSTPINSTEPKESTSDSNFNSKEVINNFANEAKNQLENIDSDKLVDDTVKFAGKVHEKAKKTGLIDAFLNFFKKLIKTIIEVIKDLLDMILNRG